MLQVGRADLLKSLFMVGRVPDELKMLKVGYIYIYIAGKLYPLKAGCTHKEKRDRRNGIPFR